MMFYAQELVWNGAIKWLTPLETKSAVRFVCHELLRREEFYLEFLTLIYSAHERISNDRYWELSLTNHFWIPFFSEILRIDSIACTRLCIAWLNSALFIAPLPRDTTKKFLFNWISHLNIWYSASGRWSQIEWCHSLNTA